MLYFPSDPDPIPTSPLGPPKKAEKEPTPIPPHKRDEGLSPGVHRGEDGRLYTDIPPPAQPPRLAVDSVWDPNRNAWVPSGGRKTFDHTPCELLELPPETKIERCFNGWMWGPSVRIKRITAWQGITAWRLA